MEYTSASRASRSEPHVVRPVNRDAGSARGKRSFIARRRWTLLPLQRITPVGCGEDHESPINGIADHDAMHGIPKCHRVPETLRVAICEDKRPTRSTVSSLIQSRPVTRPRAEENRRALVESL